MKRWAMVAAFCLLALTGAPVLAQEAPESGHGPGFDFWGTGSGRYFYHHLSGDCDTLDHAHGRNGAWGRWIMPLAEILADSPEEGDRGEAFVRFRCAEGAACIRQGHFTNLTETASEHAVPFETLERASIFARQVADLKTSCAAG